MQPYVYTPVVTLSPADQAIGYTMLPATVVLLRFGGFSGGRRALQRDMSRGPSSALPPNLCSERRRDFA